MYNVPMCVSATCVCVYSSLQDLPGIINVIMVVWKMMCEA